MTRREIALLLNLQSLIFQKTPCLRNIASRLFKFNLYSSFSIRLEKKKNSILLLLYFLQIWSSGNLAAQIYSGVLKSGCGSCYLIPLVWHLAQSCFCFLWLKHQALLMCGHILLSPAGQVNSMSVLVPKGARRRSGISSHITSSSPANFPNGSYCSSCSLRGFYLTWQSLSHFMSISALSFWCVNYPWILANRTIWVLLSIPGLTSPHLLQSYRPHWLSFLQPPLLICWSSLNIHSQ